jgi:hypothetical protein
MKVDSTLPRTFEDETPEDCSLEVHLKARNEI